MIKKRTLLAPLFAALITSCSVPPGGGSGSIRGIKDIQVQIAPHYDLDSTRPLRYTETRVEFDAIALSSTEQANGITSVTVKLKPAFDGWSGTATDSKIRLIAKPGTTVISSRKLKGIPLKDLKFKVSFDAGGSGPLKIEYLYINATQEKNSQHITDIRRGAGVDTASFLIPGTGTRFDLRLDENKQGFGYKRTERMSEVAGREGLLYLGESGGDLYLTGSGWQLLQPAAGPGGADFSFLENNAERGEFD
jgi:hypothetical protein